MKWFANVTKKYFIFDGYNVIHANPELKNYLNKNLEATRTQFIEIV